LEALFSNRPCIFAAVTRRLFKSGPEVEELVRKVGGIERFALTQALSLHLAGRALPDRKKNAVSLSE